MDSLLFRRKLLLKRRAMEDVDCGYVTLYRDGLPDNQEFEAFIIGNAFDVSKVTKVIVNGIEYPPTRSVTLKSGTRSVTIEVYFKNLYSCRDILGSIRIHYVGTATYTIFGNIDVSHLDLSMTTNLSDFLSNAYLSNVTGLECLDISNVMDLSYSFSDISGASGMHLDLSSWDTGKVINFDCLFGTRYPLQNTMNLSSINVSGWNTSSAISMNGVFTKQISITKLDLSSWDMSKVIDMSEMFYKCYSLKEVKMLGRTNPNAQVENMFKEVASAGTFIYNEAFDYSHIISQLPSTWTAIPSTRYEDN